MGESRQNYEQIGRRIRARRLLFNLTTQALSRLAGVARGTVVRLERGEPCTDANVFQIRRSLWLWQDQLQRNDPESERFAVHRAKDTRWTVSHPKSEYQQKRSANDADPHEDDPEERRRLGRLGFQPFFTAILDSELPGGILAPALMELHRPSWVSQHYGEEFVYCLRGAVALRIESEECVLETGDSITFDANRPHQYVPFKDGPNGEPPLILYVSAVRLGKETLIALADRPRPQLIRPEPKKG